MTVFYSAIIALLAYLAREKLCTDTQYAFPIYLSKHIQDMMPGWRQKEKGGSVVISVLLKLQIGHPNNYPLTPGDPVGCYDRCKK